ncbi:MAG: hypothetical protein GY844_02860, partial [Bradyrhizobium sp.]|nr:hypothetical protein [Bradyrhizobium sp.]
GGDCDANGQVLADAAKNCTAAFVRETHALAAAAAGSGTVSGAGVYPAGTAVTLTAAPNAGWIFDRWSGDCDVNGQAVMDADKACTAVFLAEETATLNVTVTGSGTVTGAGAYPPASDVTLEAVPDDGWTFENWGGDCDANGQVMMDGDKTCAAAFVREIYTLAASGSGSGAITGAGAYPSGTVATLGAVPDSGWMFAGWGGDCGADGQVTMDGDKACAAVFTAVETLTPEQFAQLPPEALGKLGPEQISALSPEIYAAFTPEQLAALDDAAVRQMPDSELAELFVYLNAETVSPADVSGMLPPDWRMDAATGELVAPEGTVLTLQADSPVLPAGVSFTGGAADLSSGFGLGGTGVSAESRLNQILNAANLSDFILTQKENGILSVKGTGAFEGIEFAFMPDPGGNIVQVGEEIPVGLSYKEGGWPVLTTPDHRQFTMAPAPKDPAALSAMLDNGEVEMGAQGDVFLDVPEAQAGCGGAGLRRVRGEPRIAMFDPFIEPAPGCAGDQGIFFGKPPPCMENRAPLRKGDKRQADGGAAWALYADGTFQQMRPTVYTPGAMTGLARDFDGMEKAVFNVDGSWELVYQGNRLRVQADFCGVATTALAAAESVQPGLVVNADGTVAYVIQRGRERINARLQAEFAPEDVSAQTPAPGAFGAFDAEQAGLTPPEAFSGMTAAHLAVLDREAARG